VWTPIAGGSDVTELVRYEVAGGVATLTMDSHHNRNALSPGLLTGLLDGVAAADADPDVRVLVLSHAGTVFCSGVDLKGAPADSVGGRAATLPDVLDALVSSRLPVVARVGGAARAGGLGLIGAADIAVTTLDATFAFTEVRIGVVPAVISATVLPRITPRAAAELLLTGDVFDGRRAAEIGLVTAAVPAGSLDSAVGAYVGSLVRGGPGALAATKELLRRRPAGTLKADLDELTALSVRHFTSDEGREGIASFRERRDPAWIPSAGDAG
jgi:methylglutaconyl-CoA hydratase